MAVGEGPLAPPVDVGLEPSQDVVSMSSIMYTAGTIAILFRGSFQKRPSRAYLQLSSPLARPWGRNQASRSMNLQR